MDVLSNLKEYTVRVEKRLDELLPSPDCPHGRLISAARYSLSAGGKRIRPLLTMLFCEACCADAGKALDAACAVECMHTFSLIHDDLPCMDDDDMRRGRKSCHKEFDESTAVLAGDALAIIPFEIISSSQELSAPAAVKCIRVLSRMSGMSGMTGGQQIDTQNDGRALPEELLLKMYSMKTSDMIKAACCMGVYCAQCADEADEEAAVGHALIYAENLGLAFQITDDILDITATSQELGKPVGSDEKSDKRTYASLFGIQAARKKAEEYTGKAIEALSFFDRNDKLTGLTRALLDRRS